MQHCLAADSQGVARPATIQNCYSLLHRTFEVRRLGPGGLRRGLDGAGLALRNRGGGVP